ncbi:hypothetical protein EV702DRAFT_1050802 [Suillus placidus]|uniref:Ribonuclease H1 N-terminal domain-containing protein n=1 Tax=Suillus placidus TaxID=48579 RepID=A0A9P6ZH43_9AGAM|nr:hypothetical protein EV702DRAFT_1050802 [Suillus placidus]
MRVFPMLVKEQTFSLSELVTAVELLHDQLTLKLAHSEAIPEADQVVEAIAVGYCPHKSTSHEAGDKECSDWTSLSDLSSSPSTINSAATPGTVATPAVAAAPATTPVSPPGATPAIAAAPVHGSTLASVCWYVVTIGRETGIFQGWHNVHSLVVGVPGACFGRYSSHASADESYVQALEDGTVQQLPE